MNKKRIYINIFLDISSIFAILVFFYSFFHNSYYRGLGEIDSAKLAYIKSMESVIHVGLYNGIMLTLAIPAGLSVCWIIFRIGKRRFFRIQLEDNNENIQITEMHKIKTSTRIMIASSLLLMSLLVRVFLSMHYH